MLHDALGYQPDTVVVDVEEWTDPRPARRPTGPIPIANPEVLTVQVRLDDGRFHRPMAGTGGTRVACGRELVWRQVLEQRHETYSDRMCVDGCFSPYELDKAEKANQATKAANNRGDR